jgi:hypothetical protein
MLLKTSFNMTVHSHGMKTPEPIIKLGWTVHFHPPYIPDFHLFGALRDAICGKGFGSDDQVIEGFNK